MAKQNIQAFLIKIMKPKLLFFLAFLLLAILVSACHTSSHHYPSKKKNKKRNCNCSEFSYFQQNESFQKTTLNISNADFTDFL